MPIQLNKSKEELRKFGRNTTDYTKLSIVGELDIIPRPGLGSVTFAGNIKSETDPSDFYRVTVQFFNVKFYKNDQDNTVKVEGAGDTPFMMIPTIRQSNAALKCRCFTGDTVVPLADGTHKTMSELVGVDKFYVYSFDTNKKEVVIGEASNCELKEFQAELYEVTFDNGSKVKCTGDHEFLTKDGYVRADALVEHTSIEPLYRKLSDTKDDLNRIGYEMIYNINHWKFSHYLADEFNLKNGNYDLSSGTVRHHVDFNKLNNSPENILRMNWYAHLKLHQDRMVEFNPMRDKEVAARMSKTQRELGHFESHSNRMKKSNPMKNSKFVKKMLSHPTQIERSKIFTELYSYGSKSEEVRKKISSTRKSRISNGTIDVTQALSKASERVKELIESGKSHLVQPERIESLRKEFSEGKSSRAINFIKSNKNFKRHTVLKEWLDSLPNGDIKLLPKHQEKLEYSQYHHFLNSVRRFCLKNDNYTMIDKKVLNKNDQHYNHKVVSVIKLEERQDVYCFTVKDYGNFAISLDGDKPQSSGVFVHNCPDFRFSFEKQLYDKDSLIGNWRRYKRKTPPSVRPAKPKNPNPIGHDF
jgi:DNA gyrase subunit B